MYADSLTGTLTVGQEVLGSECIFRQGHVATDGSIVQGEDLVLVLEFVVTAQRLQTERDNAQMTHLSF